MSRVYWFCRVVIASLSVAGFAACGGGDDDDDDGGNQVDAGAGEGGCPIASALGTFEPEAGAQAFHFPQEQMGDPSVRIISLVAIVKDEGDGVADLLQIQLWDGFGVFADGQVEPGEYAITGAETAEATCGACVYLLGNARFVNDQPVVDKQYIATAGNITIDEVGQRADGDITGTFSGSITGLTFTESDANDENGGALEGGCQTTLEAASWEATLANGEDAGI